MSYIINGKKISDLLMAGVTDALESEYELEDVIASIKNLRDKVKFLEELKRQRAASLKSEILKWTGQIKILEEIVMNTMEKTSHKSLNFPGVGKASVINRKGKWIVEDEYALLEYLEDQGDEIWEKVVVEKTSVVKKELDSVLSMWKKTGDNIPDSVSFDQPEKTLKISYDKDADIDEPDIMEEEQKPKAASETNYDNFPI